MSSDTDKKTQKEVAPPEFRFKLWDAYDKEDKDIFFGRDWEKKAIYDKTFASNLLLIYGVSATGKTSLIKCGLGNMFEETDWLPIMVRKGDNIVESLVAALQEKTKDKNKLANKPIREKIHLLFLEHFRPVFLIFDQFEELFILGTEDEENHFFSLLTELLDVNFQCKIIISIREDYLAYLDRFEDHIPSLFFNRFRVERMRYEQLEEVILKTCEKAGIQLGEEEKKAPKVIKKIIKNIRNQQGQVDLGDLQVYLDHLHREGQKQQEGTAPGVRAPIRFTRKMVADAGRIDKVLGLLLEDQLLRIEEEMEQRGTQQKGIPLAILTVLVSDEETKHPRDVEEIKKLLQRKGMDIKDKDVDFCIERLIKMRILNRLS